MSGRLNPGAKLPPIEQLAVEFGVSRMTLRQAFAILADEGLISSMQGRGTFVDASPRKLSKVRLESGWEQLLGTLAGNKPATLEVEEHVDALPALPEEGHSSHDYRFMRRVHDMDGTPYCLIEIYLDRRVYEKAPKTFDTQMVIPHLRKVRGLKLKRMRQTFQIGSANFETARVLGVQLNAPVGIVRRLVTDKSNRIVYLGTGSYRSDVVVFETTIDVPAVR